MTKGNLRLMGCLLNAKAKASDAGKRNHS
jgi:hypothetical protein